MHRQINLLEYRPTPTKHKPAPQINSHQRVSFARHRKAKLLF